MKGNACLGEKPSEGAMLLKRAIDLIREPGWCGL
jgi:hypothetical protein